MWWSTAISGLTNMKGSRYTFRSVFLENVNAFLNWFLSYFVIIIPHYLIWCYTNAYQKMYCRIAVRICTRFFQPTTLKLCDNVALLYTPSQGFWKALTSIAIFIVVHSTRSVANRQSIFHTSIPFIVDIGFDWPFNGFDCPFNGFERTFKKLDFFERWNSKYAGEHVRTCHDVGPLQHRKGVGTLCALQPGQSD